MRGGALDDDDVIAVYVLLDINICQGKNRESCYTNFRLNITRAKARRVDPHAYDDRTLSEVLDEVEIPLPFYEPILGLLQEPRSFATHVQGHFHSQMQRNLVSSLFVKKKSFLLVGDPCECQKVEMSQNVMLM